jgi:glycerol-3-phosphate acyltransferase PlsY
MTLLFCLLLAYGLGSIPFGWLIGRYWLGLDVRTQGSGNIGMTNVMRVGGKAPGLVTFLLDFGKGLVAVLLAAMWLSSPDEPATLGTLGVVAAAAILGHIYPLFLGFKGGKGVATLFGTLFALNFWLGLASAGIWAGMFRWKRISSLSAITLLGALPLLSVIVLWLSLRTVDWGLVGILTLLSSLLLYRHKENVQRLRAGTEAALRSPSSSQRKSQ